MPDNDIYNNKERYENLLRKLDEYTLEPTTQDSRRKYWIKNKKNLQYYKQLFKVCDVRDISFIRRLRLFRTLLIVGHVLEKDFSQVEREDIDDAIAFAHKVNKSNKSKRDFALDLKFMWRQLFPAKDSDGRKDDTIFPHAVRQLNGKVDKSREKLRGDKFTMEEYEQLISSFSGDPRMQALLTVSFESLGRPQELLGRKIKDVELHDNYAKIYISEHGKEGVGFLQVIDSFFYLSQWINQHPMKKDKNSYLFINTGRVNRYQQMTPFAANKLIRERCQKIGINKPITLYSLKRNSVTAMRLGGKTDLEIQHKARWTSNKQLKTYDMSNQEESFRIELIKLGKIKPDKQHEQYAPKTKICVFCSTENGIAEIICSKCKRPLDREMIEKEFNERELQFSDMKDVLKRELMKEIMSKMKTN